MEQDRSARHLSARAAQRRGKVAHPGEARLGRQVERALDGLRHLGRDTSARLEETGLHQRGEGVLVRRGAAPALGDLLRRAVLVSARRPAVSGQGTDPFQHPRDPKVRDMGVAGAVDQHVGRRQARVDHTEPVRGVKRASDLLR